MKKAFMYFGFGHFLWLWGTFLIALMNEWGWINTGAIRFDVFYLILNLGFLLVLISLAFIRLLDFRI